MPVILADTAGLRDAASGGDLDPVEQEGVRRAVVRAERADLRLVVFDAGLLPERDGASEALAGPGSLKIFNKSDLAAEEVVGEIAVSAKTGSGIEKLLAALCDKVAKTQFSGNTAPLTRVRHRQALEDCMMALRRVIDGCGPPELAAEDLRHAAQALGRITGRIDVEDILDAVFEDFCIGK